MLKSKTKGLFVEWSEFSVLAARTSGYKLPMVVEEIGEFDLKKTQNPAEIRAFFESIADFKGGPYFVARCGVYPEGRYVRFYEAETLSKVKDQEFLTEVLRTEFKIQPESHNIAVLDARDGADFDFEKPKSKRLLFCGAPEASFLSEQDRLLETGIYPEHLELSTVTTLGGVADYARFNEITTPILFLELTSESANISILNSGKVDASRSIPFGLDSIYPLLQKELGLKDEASARKLFYSNTFDFAEMGPKLLRRMVKELQATSGFYEVQTGQTIGYIFLSVLPKNLGWITKTVADSLGLEILNPSLNAWLESLQIKLGDDVEVLNRGNRWMGLFSLMGEYHLREEVADESFE